MQFGVTCPKAGPGCNSMYTYYRVTGVVSVGLETSARLALLCDVWITVYEPEPNADVYKVLHALSGVHCTKCIWVKTLVCAKTRQCDGWAV